MLPAEIGKAADTLIDTSEVDLERFLLLAAGRPRRGQLLRQQACRLHPSFLPWPCRRRLACHPSFRVRLFLVLLGCFRTLLFIALLEEWRSDILRRVTRFSDRGEDEHAKQAERSRACSWLCRSTTEVEILAVGIEGRFGGFAQTIGDGVSFAFFNVVSEDLSDLSGGIHRIGHPLGIRRPAADLDTTRQAVLRFNDLGLLATFDIEEPERIGVVSEDDLLRISAPDRVL